MESKRMMWRKSTYSDSGGENCVETAGDSGVVLVRDTANRDGGALAFGPGAWATFLTSIR
jgi:hypothetical protein